MGIPQDAFFRQVLTLNIQVQTKRDFIHRAITLILDQPLNRYTLYQGLMLQILDFLKVPDLKEAAVAECQRLIHEMKMEFPKAKGRTASLDDYSNREYKKTQRLQNLAMLGFLCYASLGEYDQAIAFFKKNHSQDHEEVALYILLGELFALQLPDYWRREYEAAVQKGVVPREKLQQVHKFLCANGRFPEGFY